MWNEMKTTWIKLSLSIYCVLCCIQNNVWLMIHGVPIYWMQYSILLYDCRYGDYSAIGTFDRVGVAGHFTQITAWRGEEWNRYKTVEPERSDETKIYMIHKHNVIPENEILYWLDYIGLMISIRLDVKMYTINILKYENGKFLSVSRYDAIMFNNVA